MCIKYAGLVVSAATLSFVVTAADNNATDVEFRNIASDFIFSGINYERKESPRIETRRAIQQNGLFMPDGVYGSALKDHGAPGIAVFDYDNDGDLDLYVTNGPGRANSLYQNQLSELQITTFIDVADSAGVTLTDLDGSGVCFGDIDNDGDHDLMVLSTGGQNSLLENNGDGTFNNITQSALPDSTGKNSTSCSMGDIDNDGLLDITVANNFDDWSNFGPVFLASDRYRIQANQLYFNLGNNRFDEQAEERGLRTHDWFTWATAMVDYDLDGDVDILYADDQAGNPAAFEGGEDVGVIRVYKNDGTGNFADVTNTVGTARFGGWMGFAFADLNSDGNLDIFATNFGDFYGRVVDAPLGELSSGWFLGSDNGTFSWPGVGSLGATPFGWGVVASDLDNDTDTDIAFFGGLEMGDGASATNPGTLLLNDSQADFILGELPFVDTDYQRKIVQGVAAGDLNQDGFVDIVTVSSKNWPANQPLIPIRGEDYDSPFEQYASVWPIFTPNDPTDISKGFFWNGIEVEQGTIAVELNETGFNNHWAKVKPLGAAGKVENACVNRDGIGAVFTFTPEGANSAMKPVLGGASYASQEELTATFGMGQAESGTVEVLWPGGVRNKLYDVDKYEMVEFPEIPCSYADPSVDFIPYKRCLTKSLWQLYKADMIDVAQFIRFYHSAIRAYEEFNQ